MLCCVKYYNNSLNIEKLKKKKKRKKREINSSSKNNKIYTYRSIWNIYIAIARGGNNERTTTKKREKMEEEEKKREEDKEEQEEEETPKTSLLLLKKYANTIFLPRYLYRTWYKNQIPVPTGCFYYYMRHSIIFTEEVMRPLPHCYISWRHQSV